MRLTGSVGPPEYRQSLENSLDTSFGREFSVKRHSLSKFSASLLQFPIPFEIISPLHRVVACSFGWFSSFVRGIGLLSLFLKALLQMMCIYLATVVLTRNLGPRSIGTFLFTRTSGRLRLIMLSSTLKYFSVQKMKSSSNTFCTFFSSSSS